MTPSRKAAPAVLATLGVLALALCGPLTSAYAHAPVVAINPPTSPTNDATPELSGSAGSEAGDLAEVELRIYDGEAAGGTPRIDAAGVAVSAGAWSYTVPSALPDGTYTALAIQENTGSEVGESQPVSFTVDTKAPRLTIGSPANDALLSTSRPTYSGSAGHESGDLPAVSVKLYTGLTATGSPLQTLHFSAAEWGLGVLGPELANGIYTALAEQADSAGNTDTRQATFAISVSESLIEYLLPPVTAGPAASFRWFPAHPLTGEAVSLVSTSTDVASAITGLAWALNPEAPFSPGSTVVQTSFLKAGSYPVSLRATNAADLSSTITETILVSAPPATLIAPFPVVRIAGNDKRSGTRIALLTVEAPLGANVQVSCHGRGCPRNRVSVRTVTHTRPSGTALLSFARYQHLLHPGAVLEVRVSKTAQIGKYTRLTVRSGKLPTRVDECLNITGTQPIACPG